MRLLILPPRWRRQNMALGSPTRYAVTWFGYGAVSAALSSSFTASTSLNAVIIAEPGLRSTENGLCHP